MTKCGCAELNAALGAAIAVAVCCLAGITGLAETVLVQTPNAAINNKAFPMEDLLQTLQMPSDQLGNRVLYKNSRCVGVMRLTLERFSFVFIKGRTSGWIPNPGTIKF